MIKDIDTVIITIHGQRVILDVGLAMLYNVAPKRLNEQVKRNRARFPDDFMFQLEDQEAKILRSQIATAKCTMRRTNPYAFTEHGVVMAANIVSSKVAIDASILLVRCFVKMRTMLSEHIDLKRRLLDVERRLAQGFDQHEDELREIPFLIS
jgi:hypothetical protein